MKNATGGKNDYIFFTNQFLILVKYKKNDVKEIPG